MRDLKIINETDNFKVSETGTLILFNAFNLDDKVTFDEDDKLTFKIKNSTGFVKEVSAILIGGGTVPSINTADLTELTPDDYWVELWNTDSNGKITIYPDKGFVPFSVNQNTLQVTGNIIPNTSLQSFENEFSKYVASIKTGPAGPQGIQGPKGDKGDAGSTTTVSDIKSMLDLFSQYYQVDAGRAGAALSDYNYYNKVNLTLYNYNYDGATTEYYPFNSESGGESTLSPIPLDKGCQNSGIQIDFDLNTTASGGTFTPVLPDFPNITLPSNSIIQGTNHYSFFTQIGSIPEKQYFVNLGLKISGYKGQLGISNLIVRMNNAFINYKEKYDTMVGAVNDILGSKSDDTQVDFFKDGVFNAMKPYLMTRDNLSESIGQVLHDNINNTNDLISVTNTNLSKFASASMVLSPSAIKGGNVSAFGDMDYNEIQIEGQALNLNTITVSLRVRCDSATGSILTVTDDDWAKVKKDVTNLKQRGFKILIQPYPYIADGSVAEVDWIPSDTTTWFNQYAPIIQQIAEYAQSENLYGMYIATNLVHLEQYEDNWVSIIQNARKAYSGKIFFRTNWWATASWAPDTITAYNNTLNRSFWQYVDVIAIAAYFEVTDEHAPSSTTLQKELTCTEIYDRKQDIVSEIKAFNDKWKKPIFFGELGLPPYDNAPSKPYDNQMDKTSKYSEVTQSNWFDAWYTTFSKFDWWLGYSIFEIGSNSSYNPYGKLAGSTIRMQVFGGEEKPTSQISVDVPQVPTKGDIWFVSDGSGNITAIKQWNGSEWQQFNLKLST